MNPLERLFRYATPYRGRLVAAVFGMIVYAAGAAGLAALIRPIFDSVLPSRQGLAATAWGVIAARGINIFQ